MPCVIMNAVARERARPIHPVFHSQSFLLQINDLGVPLLAVGPGTKIRQTMRMMAAGATSEIITRSHVGIVSWFSNGYDIERSTSEKGRWNGSMYSQPAPTAAIAIITIQSNMYEKTSRFDGRAFMFSDGMSAAVYYANTLARATAMVFKESMVVDERRTMAL